MEFSSPGSYVQFLTCSWAVHGFILFEFTIKMSCKLKATVFIFFKWELLYTSLVEELKIYASFQVSTTWNLKIIIGGRTSILSFKIQFFLHLFHSVVTLALKGPSIHASVGGSLHPTVGQETAAQEWPCISKTFM